MPDKVWTNPPPTQCDLCQKPLKDTFFDAKTKQGPWGCLCPNCFSQHGVGLGLGQGQMYRKNAHGQFVQVKQPKPRR